MLLLLFVFQVLRRDLVTALKRKRPDMEIDQFILYQDNAPAHRANSTQLEIDLLGFEVLEHPPYSPNLAPMDFRTFPDVKHDLRGKRFNNAHELTFAARKIVSKLDVNWYKDTYSKRVARHQKCVALNGDYVEKVRRSLDINGV